MIYLIKDFIYYKNLLNTTNEKLYIPHKNEIAFNSHNLDNLLENNIYKNIFMESSNYLNIINYKLSKKVNIYIYVQNISLLKSYYLIGSEVIMENYSKDYYNELIEYFKNKTYIINIPLEIQIIVIKNFIIHIVKNIKDKDILKNFIWNIYNVIFYKDVKNLLQYLFILNEQINFTRFILLNIN
jgi:hypothetical protein